MPRVRHFTSANGLARHQVATARRYCERPVGDETAANRRRAQLLVAEVAAPAFVVVAVVVAALAGVVVGVLAGLVVAALVAAYALRSGPGVVRRTIGGRAADPVTDARLVNLVDGLGAAAGVPAPELVVVDDGRADAMTFGLDPRDATIAVTSGLLSSLTRVELEGVLARELARIKRQDIRPATIAVAVLRLVGPITPWAERVRRAAVADDGLDADTQGVRITRYPPGLADALAKLGEPATTTRATAHLWLSADVHSSLDERIEALREL